MILDSLPKSCKYNENRMVSRAKIPKLTLDLVPESCKYSESQMVWRQWIPKMILDSLPKSCKYNANQMVSRAKIPKLTLDLVQESCKYSESQMFWRQWIQKWFWLHSQNHANTVIPWNPGGLEDQDPKSDISKITFASRIRGFCGHLSHPWSVYLDIDRSWWKSNAFFDILTFFDRS